MKSEKIKDQKIADSWRLFNDDNISTERLMAMVMDDCNCDLDRMISGLVREGILEEALSQTTVT